MNSNTPPGQPESHWPAVAAMLAVGGAYLALPGSLALGPRWLQLTLLVVLLVATVVTHRRRSAAMNQALGHLLAGVITFFLVWSLVLLVLAVPEKKVSAITFFRSAVVLWVSNVLVFAYWYWHLDGGALQGRDSQTGRLSRAFLFPQMTLEDQTVAWSPKFIDYVFLAFNTNTAFSPTDAPVLSRWAKVLTMMQASISLTVVVVLAARAINVL
jgi:cytosine/uracil/thiamine/allantoin permease